MEGAVFFGVIIKRYTIQFASSLVPVLVGQGDVNLARLQSSIRSRITVRGDRIFIEGPEEEELPLRQVFRDLEGMAKTGELDFSALDSILTLAGFSATPEIKKMNGGSGMVVFERSGFIVRSRSQNQEAYVRAARSADLTFAVGPAGTGKTYLAIAMAVQAFVAEDVERIILVRPAVEAGENLGFLPGDLKEKVDPYFRPLYDALMDMIPQEKLNRYLDQNMVEVAPLAYMRGRTLSNAFVILDEAQNTSSEQMKMFLTRLGRGSKAIVTGDLTQIDLPEQQKCGLAEVLLILRNIKGIQFVTLDETDVIRHGLVRDIIKAYQNEKGRKTGNE